MSQTAGRGCLRSGSNQTESKSGTPTGALWGREERGGEGREGRVVGRGGEARGEGSIEMFISKLFSKHKTLSGSSFSTMYDH